MKGRGKEREKGEEVEKRREGKRGGGGICDLPHIARAFGFVSTAIVATLCKVMAGAVISRNVVLPHTHTHTRASSPNGRHLHTYLPFIKPRNYFRRPVLSNNRGESSDFAATIFYKEDAGAPFCNASHAAEITVSPPESRG